MTGRREVLIAYRHLYQHSLRAVQYSSPARYAVRDRLRRVFRAGKLEDFHAARIQKTIGFLDNAARARGLEHKVVKTLAVVWFHEADAINQATSGRRHMSEGTRSAYSYFYHAIKMLNDSMGLCL